MALSSNTDPESESIKKTLKDTKTIAVVGLSDNADRPSFGVAQYLSRYYRILPLNPNIESWEGIPAYKDLEAVPRDIKIDLVNIFRRGSEVLPVAQAAIARGVPAIWTQLGVLNEDAASEARRHGVLVIMDRCIAVEHAKYRSQI